MVSADIPAQYMQEYKNRLKNEEFKAVEIAKATGSEISLMTTTANNPLKPTVTYFRKKEVLKVLHGIDRAYGWMNWIRVCLR